MGHGVTKCHKCHKLVPLVPCQNAVKASTLVYEFRPAMQSLTDGLLVDSRQDLVDVLERFLAVSEDSSELCGDGQTGCEILKLSQVRSHYVNQFIGIDEVESDWFCQSAVISLTLVDTKVDFSVWVVVLLDHFKC